MPSGVHTCCIWCEEPNIRTTKDHLFPKGVGGTLEVWVAACKRCQDVLSKMEKELSRRSIYALYTVDTGPRGRHSRGKKSRPESGVIRTRYILVKDPRGGYNEVGLRAGERLPVTLPSIQVDVHGTKRMRRRGNDPKDVGLLGKLFLQAICTSPEDGGYVGEIPVHLLSGRDENIITDSDFWPRASLGLAGELYILARNGREAELLAGFLHSYLNRAEFWEFDNWETWEIPARNPHHFYFSYDDSYILRVTGKIAYGLSTLGKLPTIGAKEDLFDHLRRYVILGETYGVPPVQRVHHPGTLNHWPEEHVAGVGSFQDQYLGIVSLYGDCHLVTFGTTPPELKRIRPIVAMCRRNGTKTRIVESQVAESQFNVLTQAMNL